MATARFAVYDVHQVYTGRAAMRTNIEIDDQLMADALRLSGLPTKKAVVEEALKLLVRMKKQESIRELRGKVRWEGDLDAMRRDDE